MKFDYGDEALLTGHDTAGILTKRLCCIVGITEVKTSTQSELFKQPIGSLLYTVEFGDGSDSLAPENLLEELSS